jgi:hypothetical protein
VVPHGGLHTIWLAALDAPGWGWVDLGPGDAEHALLLDADDSAPETRVDLDRRVLMLATPPCYLELDQEPAADPAGHWSVELYAGPTAGFLSERLPVGTYVWERRVPTGDRAATGTVTVPAAGLAVVDAR